MAVISKGLELWIANSTDDSLSYKKADESGAVSVWGTTFADGSKNYWLVEGLQEIGELNGLATSAEREKIEVTTLKDDKHVYVDGIIADSDTEAIEFKLLYDATLFNGIKALVSSALAEGVKTYFMLSSDRGEASASTGYETVASVSKFATWQGAVSGIKVDSVAVNSALTMTLTVTPDGAINLEA